MCRPLHLGSNLAGHTLRSGAPIEDIESEKKGPGNAADNGNGNGGVKIYENRGI